MVLTHVSLHPVTSEQNIFGNQNPKSDNQSPKFENQNPESVTRKSKSVSENVIFLGLTFLFSVSVLKPMSVFEPSFSVALFLSAVAVLN